MMLIKSFLSLLVGIVFSKPSSTRCRFLSLWNRRGSRWSSTVERRMKHRITAVNARSVFLRKSFLTQKLIKHKSLSFATGRSVQHSLHSRAGEAPRCPLHGLCKKAVAVTSRLCVLRRIQTHWADADLRCVRTASTAGSANVYAAPSNSNIGNATTSSLRIIRWY